MLLAGLLSGFMLLPIAALAETKNTIKGTIVNNSKDLIYANPATDGFPVTLQNGKAAEFSYIVVPDVDEPTQMQLLYRTKSNAAVVCTIKFSWDVDKKNIVSFKPLTVDGQCSKAADSNEITIQ